MAEPVDGLATIAAPWRRGGVLTTLDAALAALDACVDPAAAVHRNVRDALGLIAGTDLRALSPVPCAPIALIDGWAVASGEVLGASPQSPTPLAGMPEFVVAGAPLPSGCNAVLAADDVIRLGDFAAALAEAAPGQGVAAAGFDATTGDAIVSAGQQLTAVCLAALAAAGIKFAEVRAPGVSVLVTNPPVDGDISGGLVAAVLRTAGVAVRIEAAHDRAALVDALAAAEGDAVIVVGGTGEGPEDHALRALAEAGDIDIAGIGCWPILGAAIGRAANRPVLCLPGRPDATLAGALLLGLPLARILTRAARAPVAALMPLARKIASPPGLAELRFVGVDGGVATPLPRCPLPLGLLARIGGYVVIPAASEGFASGEAAPVYPLP